MANKIRVFSSSTKPTELGFQRIATVINELFEETEINSEKGRIEKTECITKAEG